MRYGSINYPYKACCNLLNEFEMKKQTASDLKKESANKNNGASFDWLLLGFIAAVIVLLVIITTK